MSASSSAPPPPSPLIPQSPIPWEDPARPSGFDRFVETVKLLATAPSEAFERMPTVGGIAQPLFFAVIVAWIGMAILITLVAPNIEKVSSSDQADILPSDVPFVHAAEVYEEAFPDHFAPSNTIIVVDAHDAGGVLNRAGDTFEAQTDTETARFIDEAVAWLTSEEAPDNVKTVISPTMSRGSKG